MIRFSWLVHDEVARVNPSLRLLNDALHKAGGQALLESTAFGPRLVIELYNLATPAGRPRAEVKEDLTIAQIQHARFMNVPMTEIAKSMGISVRTLHRRWKAVTEAHLHPDTPYSQWP